MSRAGRALSAASGRVRAVGWPVLQAAVAAGVAWYVAHDLLGHRQPFFAPIAATVALSTSHVQRSRRSAQMVVGVLLGIGVGELLRPLFGDGAVAIGVVVLVTLLAAVALGVGFVGEGMMFVNQAAASAILVIALHKAGTGGERATDALVGGAVALVIGVGLFPVDPLKLLWSAERDVLRSLREVLGRHSMRASDMDGDDQDMDVPLVGAGWVLAASHDVHARLTALTQARGTARTVVRVAPRRMRMRSVVGREERRVASLYLLASAVLSLIRATMDVQELEGAAPPRECLDELDELAGAVDTLAQAARPWPRPTLEEVSASMDRLVRRALPRDPPVSAILGTAVRRVAADVLRLLPDAAARR